MKRKNPEDVFDEPWMQPPPLPSNQNTLSQPDPHAIPDNYDPPPHQGSDIEQVLHSINSEPHVLHAAATQDTELSQLIEYHRSRMTPFGLVAVVLLVAILAGPVSILGTLAAGSPEFFGLMYMVAGGPVIEEMMKLGGLLFLLEKKPWYIMKGWHIVVAACISAMLFAIIENLVYSGVYLRSLSSINHESVMGFRWSVTVLLHTSTTFIGAMGLRKAWQATVAKGLLFDSQIAEPYIAAAVILHGSYNALALLFSHYLLSN